MSFKEQVRQDNEAVFMNLEEFSDIHVVNGREMTVQIDNNEMIEREKPYRDSHGDGVYRRKLLIYVKAEEFGRLPAIGRVLALDGESYTVSDAVNEGGIYSLSLEANRTGGR